ncbi:hypothetical protein OIU76_012373 [Salix suchowensis]|nr:hypothetical protein OIU76_012373 [Salix suchowensis]
MSYGRLSAASLYLERRMRVLFTLSRVKYCTSITLHYPTV